MKAPVNGECSCGFMGVVEGQTRVQMDGKRIAACEECKPELLDEPDEDALHTVRVRVIAKTWEKGDGSWFIYRVELDKGALRPEDTPEGAKVPFGLVGPVGDFSRGDIIVVHGHFVTNSRYGFQLQAAAQARFAITETDAALVAYLARFPHIGRARGEAILRHFGGLDGVVKVLDEDPNRLTEIPGLTAERVQELKEDYDKQAGFREFRLFAVERGIGEATIAAAIEAWGDAAQSIIESDPYELIELPRMGFKRADEVAMKMNLPRNDPRRCAAALLFALRAITDEGHTWTSKESMLTPGKKDAREVHALGLETSEVSSALDLLEKTRPCKGCKQCRRQFQHDLPPEIVIEDDRVYLHALWLAEREIRDNLTRLTSAKLKPAEPGPGIWGSMTPAPEQEEILRLASTEPVTILTGGPGTGKSACTRTIIDALETAGHAPVLCAPTGKAAKRMTELTGRRASTIHRLLAMYGSSSNAYTIPAGFIVVDEASMIDTELMAKLLKSIQTGTRLLIVGDVDQLPSIGPGQVLKDLLDSYALPYVRLTKIFRQSSDGLTKRIPEVARSVNEGACPDITVKGTNVVFADFDNTEAAQSFILRAVAPWKDEDGTYRQPLLTEKYGYKQDEIQVLSPQRGDSDKPNWFIGVTGLNLALQERINPKDENDPKSPLNYEVDAGGGYRIRQGDRVIQTKNNYDLTVMNGEQGKILSLQARPFQPEEHVITSERVRAARSGRSDSGYEDRPCETCQGSGLIDVQCASDNASFDQETCPDCANKWKPASTKSRKKLHGVVAIIDYGEDDSGQARLVGYTKEELRQVQLAYAITVHKAQGSQAKAIVTPVHLTLKWMLTRQLLYTAITRAEEYLLLVGQPDALAASVRNTRGAERRTTLLQRLQDLPERPKEPLPF